MQNRRWRWHSFQLFTKWTISTTPENVSALLTKGCIADFVSYARRIHRTQKWQQISFLYLTLRSKKDIRTLICDYQKHLEKLPSIYTEIFHLLLKGYSDREIAAQLHFSKQYINRIKKKIVPISFFGQYNPQKDKSREWITKKLMLRQIIFLLLHQLFTTAFLIAVQHWNRSVGAMILFPDIINSRS